MVAPSGAAAEVDFRREIRPLFQRRCYECHGQDKRKGGLRLTTRADAFTPGDTGVPVIEPSRPDLSVLYELVTSDDPEERMPKDHGPLTGAEVDLLRRWIEEGASWPAEADDPAYHWSYVKPVRPAPPEVKDRQWPRNEIDAFILARLEREGVAPAEEADRATLIRRVYLDLTGLPPSPADVDAFLADQSPDAYEKVVDRLLAQPAFGVRWAQPWLDLARYADSSGFQSDQVRSSWPYRDWVVKAINADMPFDQFTIEQLAGDLLPNATTDQKVATGFHRAAPLNLEAGIIAEESRVGQVLDRVNTTATVWLGSTIECAQCHDHKYDPFSQKEYYELLAYFNSTPDEARLLGGLSYLPGGPRVMLEPTEALGARRLKIARRMLAVREEIDAIEGTPPPPPAEAEKEKDPEAILDEVVGSLHVKQRKDGPEKDAWLARMRRAARQDLPRWQTLEVVSFGSTGGEDHEILPDGSVLLKGSVPDTSTYTVEVRTELDGITGFRIDALTDDSLPSRGPGRGDEERPDFVLSELEVELVSPEQESDPGAGVRLHSPHADYAAKEGQPRAAIDGKATTGWSIAERFKRPHWAVFLTEQPIPVQEGGETRLRFTLDQGAGFGRTIGRLKISATAEEPDVVALPFRIRHVLTMPNPGVVAKRRIDDYYKLSHIPPLLKYRIETLQRELATALPPTTLVMEELPEPRETYVFERGNYLSPGEKVSPGTPSVLPAPAPDLPPNRLGLAKWLVDRENPLTARVTVNRWWAELFGRGIVSTPEDFGAQGEFPSHPDLLDWLAVELMDSGWSRKHILREIVTSATYRQSTRPSSKEVLERDPLNELVARSPRLRMPAEMVRDNALAIAGLLSTKMGGSPVYPPQPDGIWKHIGTFQPKYVPSSGERRYRRGLYVVWRRSAPYPSFVNFDANDRTKCAVKRSRTDTPLQALTLLNDEAYVEAALGFAQRVLVDRPQASEDERLRYAFRVALAREPTQAELDTLRGLLDDQTARLAERSDGAEAVLAGIRGMTPREDVDRRQLAAWFFVANALLNLDETITRG